MKALLNRWSPTSLIFFVLALFNVLIGIFTEFANKGLNVGLVIACVVNALLIQYQYEKDNATEH